MKRYILTKKELEDKIISEQSCTVEIKNNEYIDFAALLMDLRYTPIAFQNLNDILSTTIKVHGESYQRVYFHTREEADSDLVLFINPNNLLEVIAINFEQKADLGYFQLYQIIDDDIKEKQILQIEIKKPENVKWSTDPEKDREIFER